MKLVKSILVRLKRRQIYMDFSGMSTFLVVKTGRETIFVYFYAQNV